MGPELRDRLVTLADVIDARLQTGSAPAPETLAWLEAPVGEMVLAMPVELRSWLTGS